ncbi:hypothetical protein [Paenibacillus methanolicus]|uniref:Uncharacterized protein n=1 Tax=Paenibacillus methanolicus TaxID=582686 RepID=A0A5S5BWL1_9BACL|nr:hypothetical protein [Paenibacillus methanolicus]TYP70530.1 hypothetical protein BCM02_11134 [Paenibacillus methanolicus]
MTTTRRRARLALNLILSLVLFASGAAALASADRWFAGTARTAGAPGGPALHAHVKSAVAERIMGTRLPEPGPPLGFFARLCLLIAVDLAAVSAMLLAVSRAVRDMRSLRSSPEPRPGEAARRPPTVGRS